MRTYSVGVDASKRVPEMPASTAGAAHTVEGGCCLFEEGDIPSSDSTDTVATGKWHCRGEQLKDG